MNNNAIIVINGQIFNAENPLIMAIVNITPDSFFAESRATAQEDIIYNCQKAIEQGAHILDIGAYSTRPNAPFVSEQEEINRLQFALQIIRNEFPYMPLSVDTFRAAPAEMAVKQFGVSIINDVSAGNLDKEMLPMVAKLNVPYVLMHSKGDPQTMQQQTQYQKLIPDILRFFAQKIETLRHLNFSSDIIIDPGFGFAKTLEQNYEILHHLECFHTFNSPILVGVSRKSMICKLLNCTPQEALNGTTVINTIALTKGTHILRVHDVREAKESIEIVKAMNQNC